MFTRTRAAVAAAPASVPVSTSCGPAVVESVLHLIGNTPTVHLERLAGSVGSPARIYLKLEFANPGGSHKTRAAYEMIRHAERRGRLVRGSGQTIIEGTGGNTGIGLAIVAALFGYNLVLVVPDNYSPEKIALLRAYGAEVILSDSRRGRDSHFLAAQEILDRHPDWFMPDQLGNDRNVAAHEDGTAQEIIAAFGAAPPDILVVGAGSGGHLTGIGRALKRHWPKIRICLVQPQGCDFRNAVFVGHKIQATAIGRVPPNLDLSLVDDVVDVSDDEAISGLKRLLRTEGIAVGLSSGANIAASLKIAERTLKRMSILTIAYDQLWSYLGDIQ